jgi:hypothetical protein
MKNQLGEPMELSPFLQHLLADFEAECGPVDYSKLLPIHHVLQEDILVTKDRKAGGLLTLNLACSEGETLPSLLNVKILEDGEEVFSSDEPVLPGDSQRFPFKVDIFLPMEIVQRVAHNTNDIEIIFSDGEKHRSFLLFLSWREINLENTAEAEMAEAVFC